MESTIDYKRLGVRVKELRKERKLSQAQVAEKTGCTENYVSHIETGITKPSLEMLMRLSQTFHVPMDYFFLDSPAILPEVLIDQKLADQLSRCHPETLQSVSRMIDEFLVLQEALTK